MKPYYSDDLVTIYHGDCLDVLPELSGRSIGCVFTDPPYYRVKAESWDRQWKSPQAFLDWLGNVADEWQRIMTVNGSLCCFASPKMAARVEVMLSGRFDILNRIRWTKAAGWHQRAAKEALRSYLSPWEEILFAQQFGQDSEARGTYTEAEARLRESVFEPLRTWMADELERTGWNKAALNEAMGFAPHGMADSRYFGRSQWQLPTASHYATIGRITGGFKREYEDLRREYEDLRREYEDLRREYEDLRRPFNSTTELPSSDVWTYNTVGAYPGKHPAEKPQDMIRDALAISTRPGMTILDSFMGSGSTLFAARSLGLRSVGIEMSEEWCELVASRLSDAADAA